MAINFKTGYNPQSFKNFLRVNLLGDKFNEYSTPERLLPGKTQYFVNNEIYRIGEIKGIEKDVSILQIKQKSKNDPRVSLTKDTFKLMQDYGIKNAIVVLRVDNISSWRLSLLTTSYNEDLKKEISNPRRYSYILGEYEKVKTPEKFLVEKGFIEDFEDLKSRFDVEVVRKEFFRLYIDLFLEVYDNIVSNNTFSKIIKDWDIEPVSFAKNLMGKLIFLYFIQKKGWLGITDKNTDFGDGDRDFFKHNIDKLAADGDLFNKHSNFYNDFLEPLFYSGLNQKNPNDRHEKLNMKVPYLNGGLFQEEYDWKNTTINLNNQIFKNIIDSFDTYNFTIDEDDPYDREIAVDPEMLGKIFESMISITSKNIDEYLDNFKKAKQKSKVEFVNQDNILNLHLGKDNNKDLGAFYTPREIVNYMTKESLYNYLVNDLSGKNPGDKEEIREIVKKLFEYKDKHLTKGEIDEQAESGYLLIKKYVFDILDALKNVKILDPAVGSGAFPMGILQEILGLYRYLIDIFHLEKKSDYEIKKDIIQNNIHGVDIDPGAVDIARLRFWLCLIVDAINPIPLPNLDFKFVCANSLIPLDKGGLFTNEEFVSTLKNIKDKFFSCSDHEEKDRLKRLFLDTKESLFIADKNKLDALKGTDGRITKTYREEYKKYVSTLADKRVKQMLNRDPFDIQKSNDWFDSKMIFDNEKFDIVIGNPPYISYYSNTGSTLSEEEKEVFLQNYETVLKKDDRINSMNLMMEKGLKLLKDGGVLSFITNKTVAVLPSYKHIRQFVLKNYLIDYFIQELSPFDAVVDCIIIELKNERPSDNGKFRVVNPDLLTYTEYPLSKIFENRLLEFKLSKNPVIIEKIKQQKLKLEDILIVNRGANIGGCFSEFLSSEKESSEYRKYLPGTANVKKYYLTWCDEDGFMKLDVELEKKLRLEGKTLALGDPSRFDVERLFIPESSQTLTAVYTDEEYYSAYGLMVGTSNNGYPIKVSCAIINSKIISFFAIETEVLRKGNKATPHVGVKGLNSIPIPSIDENIKQKIIELVDRIQKAKKNSFDNDTSELENQIDKIMYKLYGLTDEEIQIVEDSVK